MGERSGGSRGWRSRGERGTSGAQAEVGRLNGELTAVGMRGAKRSAWACPGEVAARWGTRRVTRAGTC